MDHAFTITIGDWSGDGHGKNTRYHFTANKPIQDVREAYFAAKRRHPELCPEKFCERYEDHKIKRDVCAALRLAGAPLPAAQESEDDGRAASDGAEYMDEDTMVGLVAWFIGQGDPELTMTAKSSPSVPDLSFYGFDKQGRHIGFIGYGLFCS